MRTAARSWLAALTVGAAVAPAPFVAAAPLYAQAPAVAVDAPAADGARRVLTLDDYGEWKRINSTDLSPDGVWLSYGYSPNEGDDTLFVKQLDGATVYTMPLGAQPTFSDDSRWVAYLINPPGAGGRGGARQGGQGRGGAQQPAQNGPTRKLQLRSLASGETHDIPNVASFRFSDDGRWLVALRNRASREADHEGADLVLRELATGRVQTIGNVSDYAINDGATLLALTVDAADQVGNGVYLFDLRSGTLTPLHTGDDRYARLTWNEAGSALAVLHGDKPEKQAQRANTLVVATGVGTAKQAVVTYDPAQDASFPAGMVLSELATVRFSDDDARVFLGIKEQEPEVERGDEPQSNVDVWHWKDEDVQSVQIVRAEQLRRATHAAVFNIAPRRFLRLGDDGMRNVTQAGSSKYAIGRLDEPYRHELSWGGSRADYYRIDLDTGERTLMVPALRRQHGTSPDGRWLVYLKDETLQAHEIATGRTIDLSALAGVSFVDATDDHDYELPSYGLAGWTRDGKAVIAQHRYDLWYLPVDGGKAVNLTQGVGDAEKIRFRVVDLDDEDEQGIDTSQPILLQAYGDRTKKSGYYEVRLGQKPTPVLFEDRSIGSLNKAEKADRVLFTKQTFQEFPDYWVGSTKLTDARKVTNANPQLDEYAWGRRILIDYTDARGNELQATLALPANYQPGQKYPMLVYFYELMSQNHHQFSMPTYDDRPHMSTYASDGYLVLQPDVVYEIGKPGTSALDDVGSAVRKVIELGYADPERIGLQGHSWGGYQSSYIVTQTDMFAAVVTGAPPTNLVSFYNELYKSSGTVQQGIMEIGQVRMGDGATPWSAHELYESQSPIHQAEKITTPFMILHGTEDGAVDWHQGLEYYNAARRLGKEVILLSYPGEGHHLGRKENQVDFQTRMKQYFDHYLKGAPAPQWLVDGVPHLQKGGPPKE
jgi:dipeptidyl aminopeptidase/acylaminoacyl peptidase